MEVAFDVCLLERLDLAREHVFKLEVKTKVVFNRPSNEFESEKRRFGTRAHCRDSHLATLELLHNLLDIRNTSDEVMEDSRYPVDGW